MENFNPQTELDGGAGGDIWDRVPRLAPTCRPAGVPLFRARTRSHPAQAKSRINAALPSDPSPVVIEASALPVEVIAPAAPATRKLAWEKLMVAAPDQIARSQMDALDIAVSANSPTAQAFDLLRTRLLQTLKANGWSRVAVTSPSPGCGSTFTASNLAVSLSRLRSCRTVLTDLNLRAPGVARAFGLAAHMDFRRFLVGDVPARDSLVRYSDNLALALVDQPYPASTEMLCDPRCLDTLNQMQLALNPDLVLYDMPPMLAYDDVAAFLPHVDGVLLVADGTQTVSKQIAECEKMIAGQSKLLGVVLNRSRDRVADELRYENA